MSKTMKSKSILFITTAIVLASVGGGIAYKMSAAEASAPVEAAVPAPPTVSVMVMQKKPVQIWQDFSGRLNPVDYVELRPQVSGALEDIRFEDGQIVKKGDVLFVIDPAPYEAAVSQAKAAVQSARNQSELARKDLARAEDLVKTGAVPKRTYDERQSNALVSKNTIDSAEAQLRQAQINLDHAYIKAPISGRISRAELTEGNLIQAGANAPVLTTIASNEGIYADFEVDEQAYLKNVYSKARDREEQRKILVQMILNSDTSTVYDGTIESFDNRIDPATGTIRARALFDNKDGGLLPGMFVNVRLGSSGSEDNILVPEVAIGTDQDRKFVYVIGPENKIAYREIVPGTSIDGSRVVLSGLNAGDQVVVEGIMKLRPDMVVTPKIVTTTTVAASQ